jgi:uncharacterized protein
MKKLLLILIPIALFGYIFIMSGGNDEEYINEIEKYQVEKHDFFKNSQGSPFVQKDIEYKKVEFFPIDPDFKVSATLERLTKRETVSLTNSDGSIVKYIKFARASFKLKGEEHSLLILKPLGFGNQYLTAFGDETSGETTYGGGRYLDLVIGKSDLIEIDFNKAYNPYCAYVADYLCPLPPQENFLVISLEVGEKNYPH